MQNFADMVQEFSTTPYDQLDAALEYDINVLGADFTAEEKWEAHRSVMAVHCALETRLPGYTDHLRRLRKAHPYRRNHLKDAETVLWAMRTVSRWEIESLAGLYN